MNHETHFRVGGRITFGYAETANTPLSVFPLNPVRRFSEHCRSSYGWWRGEARAEVAATHLIWAVGYFVEEHYYRRRITVEQLPTLERGMQYVGDDGWIEGARLERKEAREEKIGDWEWFDNPFVGTREWNGLRVMMALVSNWDLSADNNAFRVDRRGTRIYYVSDLGASFGTGEGRLKPKRSDPNACAGYDRGLVLFSGPSPFQPGSVLRRFRRACA